MLWGIFGLPAFGHYGGPYGDVLNAVAPTERQAQNVVSAINFDYRGLDTLGEEYILFGAVAATALLLRRLRGEIGIEASAPETSATDALRAWGLAVTACTLLFGLYMVLHA